MSDLDLLFLFMVFCIFEAFLIGKGRGIKEGRKLGYREGVLDGRIKAYEEEKEQWQRMILHGRQDSIPDSTDQRH